MTIDPIYQFDINDLFTVGLIRRKLPETKLGMCVARKVKAERENIALAPSGKSVVPLRAFRT